ncbi:hypothetical protein [Colwellia sp. RSH04]|uniref:hypothetical protein n=1 Tax=Colwellia sp. RSH04 TaxID=2305464 RepID=UPI000E58F0E9|nr:hypothetical protein [Colwellia sp. RSH04]RHW76453.1 hypothetical protein D1094_09085 [Colwellia sp. RSH04]
MNLSHKENDQKMVPKKLSQKYSKIWTMNLVGFFMDIDKKLKGKSNDSRQEIFWLLAYLDDPQNNAWVSFARIWLDIGYRDNLLKLFFANDPRSEKFVNERIQELITHHYFFTNPPRNPDSN